METPQCGQNCKNKIVKFHQPTCHRRGRKVDKQAYSAGKEIHIHTRNLAGNLQTRFHIIKV